MQIDQLPRYRLRMRYNTWYVDYEHASGAKIGTAGPYENLEAAKTRAKESGAIDGDK